MSDVLPGVSIEFWIGVAHWLTGIGTVALMDQEDQKAQEFLKQYFEKIYHKVID